MDKMNTQELISALADGQLRGEALERALQAAASDPEARQAWHNYHLVGDVLRSSDLARGTSSEAFLSRLSATLAQEAPPAVVAMEPIRFRQTLPVADHDRPAANDSVRWKLAAGVASVAAVAAIGWNVVAGSASTGGPQLAAAPAAAPASAIVLTGTERGMMMRDERLDKLLAAHRQLGGATALHTPAGFVRNATFEGPGR